MVLFFNKRKTWFICPFCLGTGIWKCFDCGIDPYSGPKTIKIHSLKRGKISGTLSELFKIIDES
jgi:hypothetical protein